jgi:hypothetical protein
MLIIDQEVYTLLQKSNNKDLWLTHCNWWKIGKFEKEWSYSIMHKLCMGHVVECEFDKQKIKFPASLITVNIQSLTMNTVVEIIMCMMILNIKQYGGCVV